MIARHLTRSPPPCSCPLLFPTSPDAKDLRSDEWWTTYSGGLTADPVAKFPAPGGVEPNRVHHDRTR